MNKKLVTAFVVLLMSSQLSVAMTTEITWSGSLDSVVVDIGGTYSGNTVGQQYAGSYQYGGVQSSYVLANGGQVFNHMDTNSMITDGGIERISNNVSIDVYDGWSCGTSSEPFTALWSCGTYSNIFNEPIAEGTQLDDWWLYSTTYENNLTLGYSIDFISKDSELFSDSSYRDEPPFQIGENTEDFIAVFWLYEWDATTNQLVYGAWGTLDSIAISQIPIPATAWLFFSAISTLGVFNKLYSKGST